MALILLAEDDDRLANLVREFLQKNDFDVVVEGHGAKVNRLITDLNPDVVILDLMLPGKDGLAICKDARESFLGPILMLTARDSDMDQVLGFEFGADDYVTKPAEPKVLLARIKALLRRSKSFNDAPKASLCVGSLNIDLPARKVTVCNREIGLTSHEFDLLCALVEKSGEVLSREYLFNKIYHRPYDGLDRTIDVRVSQLRKKLGDNPDTPEKIKTIWGQGYLLVADVWEESA
ncbi:MAG: DNA-binding response OmpR family regulator [Flavobacteriales bacterium]|jgi:DNA-binding response OmpR family regulator